MTQLPTSGLARNDELLRRLRAALPAAAAQRIGFLDVNDPLAIVEAFVYVRRTKQTVPEDLYLALREQVLVMLEAF